MLLASSVDVLDPAASIFVHGSVRGKEFDKKVVSIGREMDFSSFGLFSLFLFVTFLLIIL